MTFTFTLHYGGNGGFNLETDVYPKPGAVPAKLYGQPITAITVRDLDGNATPAHEDFVRRVQAGVTAA